MPTQARDALIVVKAYIEANAPGAKKGWRWQDNWSDIYSVIMDGKSVTNWWKD